MILLFSTLMVCYQDKRYQSVRVAFYLMRILNKILKLYIRTSNCNKPLEAQNAKKEDNFEVDVIHFCWEMMDL